ncbi:26S protease regulatory subunit 6A [Tripterygium wilfordii]|uniref:26S protease regulatory subunit 6A n=1 Tax=Tripterygium wilfordii TaxID=458696 RepID=A0A7J7DJL0_TRIWF|nr:AAA-ATPase At3g50940-like [Tripterygium wilfordii]XP_038704932.1 AAA-ATPase At3g50940-like [Tripterygium wilfordii]KAF5746479.1 26S protease regulatory subunit 6A [Tripterygium wilfordii]
MVNMFFSVSDMPSTPSVLSAYTSVAALLMLVRTVFNEVQTMISKFLPQKLRENLLLRLGEIFGSLCSQMTVLISEYNGLSVNEIYQASETYLSSRITPSINELKVFKAQREKNISVTINKGEKVFDIFEGIQLVWEFVSTETQKSHFDYDNYSHTSETTENRSFRLSFNKRYKEVVLRAYLPYVVERSKAIKEENKALKLYSLGSLSGDYDAGPWGSINLDHPSTFETMALDPELKNELMEDLDRFVRRRDFYRRVGKAWKRGYLLYGPPGTGKSSLIAAMANYLKFDIYDLELKSIHSNADLRKLVVSTANRSILVIEDIDCSIELQNRQDGSYKENEFTFLTLSGLLNFIDGLWSSCGDERIIVFTTNYKDRIDPALLRPGRMDKHINLSFCTPSGFKILASNYLGISTHHLFTHIEELIEEVEVTPAEVAEELMKYENVDIALKGVTAFIERKKLMKCNENTAEERKDVVVEQEKESEGFQGKCDSKVRKNQRKMAKKGKEG